MKNKHPGGNRRGRPRKAPGQKRDHVVSLNLSAEEAKRLDHNRGEFSPADYLRLIALHGKQPTPPVPPVNRGEFVRLYQLEQAVVGVCERVAAKDGHTDESDLAMTIVRYEEAILKEVRRIRQHVLGMEDL